MIRKRRFAIITAHEGLNRECFLHAKAGPTVACSSLTLKNGEFAIRVALRKTNREWSFSVRIGPAFASSLLLVDSRLRLRADMRIANGRFRTKHIASMELRIQHRFSPAKKKRHITRMRYASHDLHYRLILLVFFQIPILSAASMSS